MTTQKTGVKLKGCILWIGPDKYRVVRLVTDPAVAKKAVRLTKLETGLDIATESYDVALMSEEWWTCECGDYIYRASQCTEADLPKCCCKHINACRHPKVQLL